MMKSFLAPRAVSHRVRPFGAWTVALLAVAKLAIAPVAAQSPYYPVTNPDATLGGIPAAAANYTGTPITTTPELDYLQKILQEKYGAKVTLEAALLVAPTTYKAPTLAQLKEAVKAATTTIGGGVATPPLVTPLNPAVTLQSFARETVSNNPTNAAALAQTVAAAIVSVNPGAATARLDAVLTELTKSFPASVQPITANFLTEAAKSASTVNGIPALAAKAIAAVNADPVTTRSIIDSAVTSISGAPATVLANAAAKDNYFRTVFIPDLFNDASLNGLASHDPEYIDSVVTSLTKTAALKVSSLANVLATIVNSLPAPTGVTTADQLRGAIAIGALRNLGTGGAGTVKSLLSSPYTDAVVNGFRANAVGATDNEGGSLRAALKADPTHADAIAAGAVVRKAVAVASILQNALRLGFNQVDPNAEAAASQIVAAVVTANPTAAVANAVLGLNPTLYAQYGSTGGVSNLLAGAAQGAVSATPIENAGNVISAILQKASTIAGAYTAANVNGVVDQAIRSAYDTSRAGGVADIVFKTVAKVQTTAGFSGQAVTQAINTIAAKDGAKPGYLAVVAALAGSSNATVRNDILQAAFGSDMVPGGAGGALAATGSNEQAASFGSNLVISIKTNAVTTFTESLKTFHDAEAATSPDGVLAGLYGAILANSGELPAVVAAAVRQSTVAGSDIVTAASNAMRGIATGHDAEIQLVETVADFAKASQANRDQLLDYIGRKVIENRALAHLVATAWTVVDPNHANFVATAVAFNNPQAAAPSVTAIFKYAQITSPNPYIYATASHSDSRAILDQPGAAAAITAGVTTGILEARLSTANTKTALVSAVTAAVAASVSQNGTPLLGQAQPFINNGGDTSSFRQSNGSVITGVPTAANIVSGTVRTVGAAGAITGYIAEVTGKNDITISATTAAVLKAATTGNVRQYAVEIAQAAAQAFRWVVDSSTVNTWQTATNWTGTGAREKAVATAIANAILPSVNGFNAGGSFGVLNFSKLYNAALFGIYEAANGTIGAGALGLNAVGLNSLTTDSLVVKPSGNANGSFFLHKSASGTPVTDVFNL